MWADIQHNIYVLDYDRYMSLEATQRYRNWYKKHGMTRVQNPSHNVPTTGYTPTAHDWGIVKQGVHEVYQLLTDRASYEDCQKRLRQMALDVGDEDMLHRGIFHYEDEDAGGSDEEDDSHEREDGGEDSQAPPQFSTQGVSFDQPPPQFSTHQGGSFDQPPPCYDSYQWSTQPDDYVKSFLNSSFYYGDTTGAWNTGGGDGAGPSTQH
ncbi:unnamed protein product [Cuscuta epithymum]|uniref:Uncharacterized protein n=1 Tax=Cuscuta epithymum TaxID=186058 RepID=A0AAV0DRY4_9ASTE|nr:unnamed protein product [Cuscuta epithymum]CAH9142390.1 unnamed protein product [Cuscuta epithymum]